MEIRLANEDFKITEEKIIQWRVKNRTPEHKAACRKYEKTRKGFLMRAYRNMQSRILGIQFKKHHLYAGKELMDREEFYSWSLKNDDFNRLFDEWTTSSYTRTICPSIDRIDSDFGYFIGNVRWVTFSENCRNIKRRNINS